MRARRSIFVSFTLAAITAPGACTGARAPSSSDESAPSRIVSLIPSITETIVALGKRHVLVGRTDYDREPDLAALPSVGGVLTPGVETLLALKPELVLAWPVEESRLDAALLEGHGIRVVRVRTDRLDDLWRNVDYLGRLLGAQRPADSLARALRDSLAAVRASVADRAPVSVFYLVWHDPPMTTGSGTFVHDLITVSGGQNVFADVATRWPVVSLESILMREPEVIVVPRSDNGMPSAAVLRRRAGWRELAAVRSGRLIEIDADRFNRPGPRLAETARLLARLLHGDVSP